MTNFLRVTKRKSGLKERGIPRRTRCDHFVRAHPALPAARRQTAAPITRLDHSCASFTRFLARRRTGTRPLGRSQTKLVRFSSEVGRANMDTNRLAKELREIAADTKSGVTVTTLGDNLGHMQGTLQGASRNGARAEPLGSEADRPDFGRLPMPLFRFPVDSSVSRLTRFPSPRSRPEPAQDPRNPRTRAASSTWTSNSRMRTRSSRRRCGS